jgi:hypothetical protein
MSDETNQDPYCLTVTASATRADGRLYQRTIMEQYFDTAEEQKAFQQKELLEIVGAVGMALVNYGNRHESEKKGRQGR